LTGLEQASYSFLDDLNSPNLDGQAELDELAADPMANLSESNSSTSSSESDEAAKVNEESISNENASSGLTVSL
jgi:hypothetical protein